MTAEIAVANKSAVALAADSKVTIGSSRNAKTYDTVNKVFTLSKSCPVGIMIFGNAEFMEYPWETIIKLYRRERGWKVKGYIRDWADDFEDYISAFGNNEEAHRLSNIKSIVTSWLYRVEDVALGRAISEGINRPSTDYDDLFVAVMSEHLTVFEGKPFWVQKNKAKPFLKRYSQAILDGVREVLNVEEKSKVFQIAVTLGASALCHEIDSPQSSGYVIAGFGDKEFFPTVIEHNTDGMVGDRLKTKRDPAHDISRSMSAYVGAFAQKDMVQGFMNGYDSDLLIRMIGSFAKVLEDSCLTVLEDYGVKAKKIDKIRGEITSAASASISSLIEDFVGQSRERFSGPVVDMVALLPKDELAHLAESLVALTSLRRRVSRDVETVGGPIDVALITKGDGFVWMKRKQYFKGELNPQFTRNYMNDIVEETK